MNATPRTQVQESGGSPRPRAFLAALGAAALAVASLGAALALGAEVKVDLPNPSFISPTQQRFLAPASTRAYVNTRTGAQLVIRPPTTVRRPPAAPLRAATKSAAESLESTAKLTVTGLLSMAAMATPAAAVTQDARLADLLSAWNQDFGAQYGMFDVPASATASRAAPAAALANAKAPAVQFVKRVVSRNDPVEQLVAEWNKDFGAKYGVWQPVKVSETTALPIQISGSTDIAAVQLLPMQAAQATPRIPTLSAQLSSPTALLAAGLAVATAAVAVAAALFTPRPPSTRPTATAAGPREPLLGWRAAPTEERPAPGEYMFALDAEGEMRLVAAKRAEVPPVLFSEEPTAEAAASTPAAPPRPRERR
eukprot:EG_transcript_16890